MSALIDYLLATCSAWMHCLWRHGIEPMTITDDIGPTSVRCSVCGRGFWRRDEEFDLVPARLASPHWPSLQRARSYQQSLAEWTAGARRSAVTWSRPLLERTTYARDQARLRLRHFRMSIRPDASDLAARLDRIQQLTDALANVQGDAVEQHALAERINQEIVAAKLALRPPTA